MRVILPNEGAMCKYTVNLFYFIYLPVFIVSSHLFTHFRFVMFVLVLSYPELGFSARQMTFPEAPTAL